MGTSHTDASTLAAGTRAQVLRPQSSRPAVEAILFAKASGDQKCFKNIDFGPLILDSLMWKLCPNPRAGCYTPVMQVLSPVVVMPMSPAPGAEDASGLSPVTAPATVGPGGQRWGLSQAPRNKAENRALPWGLRARRFQPHISFSHPANGPHRIRLPSRDLSFTVPGSPPRDPSKRLMGNRARAEPSGTSSTSSFPAAPVLARLSARCW